MTNKLRVNCLAKGAILVSIIIMIGLPVAHLIRTWAQDQDSIEPVRASYADDLSRLNATRVQEVWALPRSSLDAEQQLIALLNRARKSQLPVSIAGARHSMGGHVIAPDGIVIDMLPFHSMSLNDDASVLTVQAGALWSEVIPFLDRHGRSVAVMQSEVLSPSEVRLVLMPMVGRLSGLQSCPR